MFAPPQVQHIKGKFSGWKMRGWKNHNSMHNFQIKVIFTFHLEIKQILEHLMLVCADNLPVQVMLLISVFSMSCRLHTQTNLKINIQSLCIFGQYACLT